MTWRNVKVNPLKANKTRAEIAGISSEKRAAQRSHARQCRVGFDSVCPERQLSSWLYLAAYKACVVDSSPTLSLINNF
jgi:hypothetical protein